MLKINLKKMSAGDNGFFNAQLLWPLLILLTIIGSPPAVGAPDKDIEEITVDLYDWRPGDYREIVFTPEDPLSDPNAAYIKINGNPKVFHDFFPDGIIVRMSGTGGEQVKVRNLPFEHTFDFISTNSRIKLRCQATNKQFRSREGAFGIFTKYKDLDGGERVWTVGPEKTLLVRINPANGFDPFNFQPTLKSGFGVLAFLPEITGGGDYRAQAPGWDREVAVEAPEATEPDVLPEYMEIKGWSARFGGILDPNEDPHLVLTAEDIGKFYYICDEKIGARYEVSEIIFCEPEGAGFKDPDDGDVLWRFVYDGNDRVEYIFSGDGTGGGDPNYYYEYTWQQSGDSLQADVEYIKYADSTKSVQRQWHVEYDDEGQVTRYMCGECSTGCGGGGGDFEAQEYYYADDSGCDARWEGLVKKRFSSVEDSNDVNTILWNKYTTTNISGLVTDTNDEDYVYLPRPLLTEQYALDPDDDSKIKFRKISYDATDNTAVEKTWLDNDNYRLVKYYYTDASFSTLARKKEHELLNEDPDSLVGRSFTTFYAYDRVSGIRKETITHPSGKRKDVREYDAQHKRVEKTYLYDVVESSSSNEVRFEYDTDDPNYLINRLDARGGEIEYEYDGVSGLLSWRMEPNDTEGIEPTDLRIKTVYEYDGLRRIESEEVFSYDQEDEDPLKKIIYSYTLDLEDPNKWGQLESQTVFYDHNGSNYAKQETTYFKYNASGQRVRVIRPDGAVTGMSYNKAGQLEYEFVLADPGDVDEEDGNLSLISQTKYTYDDNGRIKTVEKAEDDDTFTFGSPGNGWIKTQYQYDFLGRREWVIEDMGVLDLQTKYAYNHQGELVKTTLPIGRWTETIRDGRSLVCRQIVGYGVGEEETEYALTEFKYDANRNLIEQINPNESRSIFTYDNLDRITQTVRGLIK